MSPAVVCVIAQVGKLLDVALVVHDEMGRAERERQRSRARAEAGPASTAEPDRNGGEQHKSAQIPHPPQNRLPRAVPLAA